MASLVEKAIAMISAMFLIISLKENTRVHSHIIGGAFNTDFHEMLNEQAAVDNGNSYQATRGRSFLDGTQQLNIGLTRGRGAFNGRRQQILPFSRHVDTNTVENEMFSAALLEYLRSPTRSRLRRAVLSAASSKPGKIPTISNAPSSKLGKISAVSNAPTSKPATSASNSETNLPPQHSNKDDQNRSIQPDSPLNPVNPFLRLKRMQRDTGSTSQLCSMPYDLSPLVVQLNSFLNDSQILEVLPDLNGDDAGNQTLSSTTDQSSTSSCPPPSGSWWPGQTDNLRSTCPWTWEERDLGPDAYPRKLREAKCMCKKCVGADLNGCQELRRNVTYFRRTGCQDGRPMLEKVLVPVTLGCYCAAAAPNNASDDQSSSDGLPAFDTA